MSKVKGGPWRLDGSSTKFSEEVIKAGGEKISICFQCGTCTATCPVRRFNEKYNPRLIVRAAVLGLIDKVFSNDMIWLCASCYSCTERCPRGVRPTEVIRVIRNLAVKEGKVHSFYKLQADAITQFGRLYQEEEFINDMRDSLGLSPVPPVNLEEVNKILQTTKQKRL